MTTRQAPYRANQAAANDDPYASAANAKYDNRKVFFGQGFLEMWFCTLQKGVGKVPWQKGVDSEARKRTAIDITIERLPDSPLEFDIERHILAESSDWVEVTRPSLLKLGFRNFKVVSGEYFQVEQVPHGKPYHDRETNELKQGTAIRFVKNYESLQECQDAADAMFPPDEYEGGPEDYEGEGRWPTEVANEIAGDTERETAYTMLAALWNASGKDVDKFRRSIEETAVVARHFNMESPEVAALIADQETGEIPSFD